MLENIAITDGLILAAILAAFIIIGYKMLSVLKNALIIAVLAAVFPYVLNYFFGAHFSTAYAAEMQYMIIALGLYLVYEFLALFFGIGGAVLGIFGIFAKPFVWAFGLLKALLGGKKDEKQKEKKKNDE